MNENRIPRHVRSQERTTKEKYLTIPRIYVAAARNVIGNNCTLQTSADVCAWFAVYGSERVKNEGDRRSSNRRVLAANGSRTGHSTGRHVWTTVRRGLSRTQSDRPINCYYEAFLACKQSEQHPEPSTASRKIRGNHFASSRNRERSSYDKFFRD